MRSTLTSCLLSIVMVLVVADDAGADSVADLTSTIDWSSLKFTAGGVDVASHGTGYLSSAHFQADNSLGGPGYTIFISNNDYSSPWGTVTADGAITNGSGAAASSDLVLGTHVEGRADFTNTAWVDLGSIATRLSYVSPISYPGAFAISADYSFSGFASTDLVGDSVSLLNNNVLLRASLLYYYRTPTGSLANDWIDIGSQKVVLYPPGFVKDGASVSFSESGTLSLAFDPADYLTDAMINPRIFVHFESRAYAYLIATQATPDSAPEPAGLLLLGISLAALVRRRRRQGPGGS